MSANQDRAEALSTHLDDMKERCSRALDELATTERRAAVQVGDAGRFANERLVVELLPVLDNLDRARANAPADYASLRAGVELIHRQFSDILARAEAEQAAAAERAAAERAAAEAAARSQAAEKPPGTARAAAPLAPARARATKGLSRQLVYGGLAALLAAGALWITPALRAGSSRNGRAGQGPPAAGAAETGSVSVVLPPPVSPDLVRVSILHYATYARSLDGEELNQVPPAKLAQKALAPADYLVIVRYRGEPLTASIVPVAAGGASSVAPSPKELADVEYKAGEALAKEKGDRDIECYRRALQIDPEHVNAHLQLAAYALLHGSPEEVEEHLAAVRRKDPDNADAARVERLLKGSGA